MFRRFRNVQTYGSVTKQRLHPNGRSPTSLFIFVTSLHPASAVIQRSAEVCHAFRSLVFEEQKIFQTG